MAKKKPIVSPLGQWAYPGEVTIIPSSNITMKGVNYPILGVDDLGNSQMMMPGKDYNFPGNYVTEIPQMGKGGLRQWFAEEWTDVKTGKPCGRSGDEKGSRPYPACRPKKRVNETTPKTTSEMSSAEKAKFKREKTSGKRIDYNHKRRQDGGEEDSTIENITEFFDPTGIMSWDDASKAYNQWKKSNSTLPSMNQALDMFGAVPGLGKLSKIKYLDPDAIKTAYKYIPWQQIVNAFDTVEDEVSKVKKPIKKEYGGWLDQYQDGGIETTSFLNPDKISEVHIKPKSALNRFFNSFVIPNTRERNYTMEDALRDHEFSKKIDFSEVPVDKNFSNSDFEEAYNWTKKYMSSPRYRDMLQGKDEDSQIEVGRAYNLLTIPTELNRLTDGEINRGIGGYSSSINGSITVNPSSSPNFFKNEVLPHEISHSVDRPTLNVSWARLIPEQDTAEINKRIRKNPNVESIGFWQDHGNTPEEGAINYYSDPTEVRARLNSTRKLLNQNFGVDVFNDKIKYKDLNKFEIFNNENAIIHQDYEDLKSLYNEDDLLWLLNNVSKIEQPKLNVAKYGGWLEEYQSGGSFTNLLKLALTPEVRGHVAKALVDKGTTKVAEKVGDVSKQQIFDRYRPIDYPDVIGAVVNSGKDVPLRDWQGDYHVSEEAWRLALGLPTKPKYISPSKYKPSKANDPNAQYYALNNVYDPQKLIDAYIQKSQGKPGQTIQMDALSPYIINQDMMTTDNEIPFTQTDPLQKFILSQGEDERGRYVSIYDKYDFNLPYMDAVVYGSNRKPYEFYDRFYYKKDAAGKPIYVKQKKQGGQIDWLKKYK